MSLLVSQFDKLPPDGLDVAASQQGQKGGDLLRAPVPPGEVQEQSDEPVVETLADQPSSVTEPHARHDDGVQTEPDIVSDHSVALVRQLIDVGRAQLPPQSAHDAEGIGRD